MLNEIKIIELMKESLKNYKKALTSNDLSFAEYKAEVRAYLKVLDIKGLEEKFKYIDINKADELIEICSKMDSIIDNLKNIDNKDLKLIQNILEKLE